MANLTFKQAKEVPKDDLWAILISGKNPDNTDFSLTINPSAGPFTRPTFKEAKEIPRDDLIAILISSKTPAGASWGLLTQ